ncbi:MAG: restriction endonuclease subunit S, partial [Anaerovibrio sp.]
MAVPKLRFGCTDWKKVELKDIAKRVTRKNKKNETDLPLTISSLDGLVDQREYFKKQVASKDMSGYYLIYNGEFAYNKSYSVGFDFGSVKRLDKYSNGALSTLYICFALEDIVNSDFIVGYFDSCKWNRHVSKVCAEGARNHGLLNISADDFMKMNIYLPNLEEQKKIADFLTTFDKRIAAQQNIIADLEETKKGLLQKIFSQEIRFKDDNGQDYPDWEKKRLGELCYLRGRIGFRGYTVADIVSKSVGVISLSPTNIDMGYVNTNNGTYISYKKYDESPEIKVMEGDILFTKTGSTIGKLGFVKVLKENATINPQIALITARECNKYFLFLAMNARDSKKYVNKIAVGGAIPTLSQEELKKMIVRLPCIEEQQKIADFLSTFDKKITAEKQILSDLQ